MPHRPGIFIVGYIVLKNWLVRLERENALPRIVVRNMATGEEHAIAFDEEAYSLGFGEMREYDTDTLRFTYSSMTTPARSMTTTCATAPACCARRRKCRAAMTRRTTSPAASDGAGA